MSMYSMCGFTTADQPAGDLAWVLHVQQQDGGRTGVEGKRFQSWAQRRAVFFKIVSLWWYSASHNRVSVSVWLHARKGVGKFRGSVVEAIKTEQTIEKHPPHLSRGSKSSKPTNVEARGSDI
jgi:hypothetical protein